MLIKLRLTNLLIITFLSVSFFIIGSISAEIEKPKIKESEYFYYYLDNPGSFQSVNDVLKRTRQKLIELLNDSLRYKPEIYIVGSNAEFEQLVSGQFPDWGAAVAIPAMKKIVIKSPEKFNLNKRLEELLAHEYTHLIVAQKSGFSNPPRWLNEGLAMYVSTEWSWSYNLALSKAAVFGQFIPLGDIENMNRFNQGKAQVAYAQSYLAVEYLKNNYSKDFFEKLLNHVGNGIVIEEAIYNETGLTFQEFNSDFKFYLNQRFNVLSLFMDTIILWLFLAVVVIVGFIMKYKKRRSYYEKWDEQEKYHSTDFDYGDPDHPEQTEDDDESWRK